MEAASPQSLISIFEEKLKHFKLSDAAKQLLDEVTFVPMAAISSSGRNTIIRKLVEQGDFYFTLSDTSRPKRDNDGVMEQDGVEYWFRTEKEIFDDFIKGEYLEASINHVDHMYGSGLDELRKALNMNKYAVTDMDVQGVARVMKHGGKTVPIFLLPPSYEEWRRRLDRRGTMPKSMLKNRINSAIIELDAALAAGYYKFIINDDLEQAIIDVDAVVRGDSTGHEAAGRQLAKELRDRIVAENK